MGGSGVRRENAMLTHIGFLGVGVGGVAEISVVFRKTKRRLKGASSRREVLLYGWAYCNLRNFVEILHERIENSAKKFKNALKCLII